MRVSRACEACCLLYAPVELWACRPLMLSLSLILLVHKITSHLTQSTIVDRSLLGCNPSAVFVQVDQDGEEEDEEDEELFVRAATKGLQLKQLITVKRQLLSAAKARDDKVAVANLEKELVRIVRTQSVRTQSASG